MLHGRARDAVPADQTMITMKEAAWPVPFRPGLEYNSPCHGPWNIVHIGMAVPGSHQIYVCGANCNRGVVLTAAEMQASDRYSTLTLFEEDLINSRMDELIIEGVTDIFLKLPDRPTVVFLFTVCVHRFMGIDKDYIYSVLRERFPEIRFVESSMEPISQKEGLTPDARLRIGMQSFLTKNQEDRSLVSIIGSDFKIRRTSELKQILESRGCRVRESAGCKDFQEYLSMGDSSLLICTYPNALPAVKELSARIHTPYLYLPASFSYAETDRELADLMKCLPDSGKVEEDRNLPGTDSWIEERRKAAEEALKETRALIGDTAVAIDQSAVPRYLGLARLLIEHGFRVIRLYGDAFSPEEREDFDWLIEHAPDLELCPTIHPGMRIFPRGQEEKVLAIGQKASYFHQTPHFVNMVQGEGLHGYDGILCLAGLMKEAFCHKKDTRDLVGRKGLGCKSY